MTTSPFWMVQLGLDIQGLFELARKLHLSIRDVDLQYMVHCALGELFQDHAPKPFYVQGNDLFAGHLADAQHQKRFVRVLMYSDLELSALKEVAQLCAAPDLYSAVDWAGAHAKPMPSSVPEGTVVTFDLLACPVRRASKSIVSEAGGPWVRKGEEVDAFLLDCANNQDNEELRREVSYTQWLHHRIRHKGGAELVWDEAQHTQLAIMETFERRRMFRRQHKNSSQGKRKPVKRLEHPVTKLRADMRVTDPVAFGQLLRDGIGRHRSFGFGMILLRGVRRD